jgi:hypothetical protein
LKRNLLAHAVRDDDRDRPVLHFRGGRLLDRVLCLDGYIVAP